MFSLIQLLKMPIMSPLCLTLPMSSRTSTAVGAKGGQLFQAIGRSKGGLTTKIHAVVDGLGNPLKIKLTAGNVHDIKPSYEMISGIKADYILADRAYDADKFILLAQSAGCNIVIPPKLNKREPRTYDKHMYKERHLVECFFAKLKSFRRVSTRYEKLASTLNAVVLIAACMVWLQ
jgi:transposase